MCGVFFSWRMVLEDSRVGVRCSVQVGRICQECDMRALMELARENRIDWAWRLCCGGKRERNGGGAVK